MKSFSLVLPCYNESASLPDLSARVLACAQKRKLGPAEFRLILVENGSKDDSLQVMERLKAAPGGEFIDVVRVEVNQGYGYGLWQGLKAVKTEIAAWTHADEQCDPEDAFKGWEILLADPARTERLLVKGRRHGRAFKERVISRGFEAASLVLLGKRLHEINAQPKVFHAGLIAELTDPPFDFAFDLYVLLKAREQGLDLQEIDVLFPPRPHGQSNWSATLRSKARHISKMLAYMARYRTAKG